MTNSKTERYKIAKVIEDYPSKWKVLLKWAIIQMKIGHYTDIHSIKFVWNYATQVHSCYPTCSVPFFNIYIMKANIHLKEHFYLGRGLPHTYHSSLMITPPSKERVAKGVYVTLTKWIEIIIFPFKFVRYQHWLKDRWCVNFSNICAWNGIRISLYNPHKRIL